MTSLTRILDQSSKLRQAVPIARLLSLKLQNVIKSCMKLAFADFITKRVEGLNRRDTRFVYQMTCYRMSLRNFVQVRLF